MSREIEAAQSTAHLGKQWTICIHSTFEGDMLDAEHIASLMKNLAQDAGR